MNPPDARALYLRRTDGSRSVTCRLCRTPVAFGAALAHADAHIAAHLAERTGHHGLMIRYQLTFKGLRSLDSQEAPCSGSLPALS